MEKTSRELLEEISDAVRNTDNKQLAVSIDNLNSVIDKLNTQIGNQNINEKGTENQAYSAVTEELDNKTMLIKFATMICFDLFLFVATYLLYRGNSIYYGLSLGFCLAAMIHTFLFVLDWIFIPYDSYKTIARNPVALVFYLFILACSIWVGIAVGDSYHPALETNEPYSQQYIERQLDINSEQYESDNNGYPSSREQVSGTSQTNDDIRRYDGEAERKQSKYPNR